MKHYIRTEDGKILEKIKDEGDWVKCKNKLTEELKCSCVVKKESIVKEVDTIEELIEVGDLVRSNGIINEIDSLDYLKVLMECSEITELYTKQGNDYILVAKKENGEWRVI